MEVSQFHMLVIHQVGYGVDGSEIADQFLGVFS